MRWVERGDSVTTTIPNLSERDVAALVGYEQLIPAMRDALMAFSDGQTLQPVRELLPVEKDQRYFAAMAAVMPTAMGAKMVSFYPKNATAGIHTHFASIALLDPEHGQPLAFMDGRLITEMRTAATSAAVSQALADPQSSVLALIGAGVQAGAHLAALKTIFPIENVRVWSRTPANAQAFAARHGAQAMSAEDATRGADIVVVATNAREPVLKGAWLKPGAHVNSVGSPRPDWREVDDDAMRATLVVDSRAAVMKEAGDVILSGASIYAEAGEVLRGAKPVERSETTLFKSVGMAVEDIAAARLVYDIWSSRVSGEGA